jgi:hypothetical protein
MRCSGVTLCLLKRCGLNPHIRSAKDGRSFDCCGEREQEAVFRWVGVPADRRIGVLECWSIEVLCHRPRPQFARKGLAGETSSLNTQWVIVRKLL